MHSWHWQLVSLLCLPASPLSRESIHLKRHGSLEQEPSCAHARLKGQAKATESEGRGERIPTSDSATAMVLESAESAPGARGERERESGEATTLCQTEADRQRSVTDKRKESERALEETGGGGRVAIDFSPMPCQHTRRGKGRDGLGGMADDGEPAKQSMRWRMWLGYSDGDRGWCLQHKEGYFE